MTWSKVDDLFWCHPKTLDMSPGAGLTWLYGLCYCARYLTDGFVPLAALPKFHPDSAAVFAPELVNRELWEEVFEADQLVGYRFHDYLEYQPNKTDAKASQKLSKERRSKAASLAANARWHPESPAGSDASDANRIASASSASGRDATTGREDPDGDDEPPGGASLPPAPLRPGPGSQSSQPPSQVKSGKPAQVDSCAAHVPVPVPVPDAEDIRAGENLLKKEMNLGSEGPVQKLAPTLHVVTGSDPQTQSSGAGSELDWALTLGDCTDVLARMQSDSLDSMVTDPPYGIDMSKAFDHFDSNDAFKAWCEGWAKEAFRTLKPGGHIAAFGSPRTYHCLASALESQGFEIRDSLHWLYGTGQLKGLNVSKSIDALLGGVRSTKKVPYHPNAMMHRNRDASTPWRVQAAKTGYREMPGDDPVKPEAKAWDGFGTNVKPAHEPIVLARKPLREPNVAKQVLASGTSALNLAGCSLPGRRNPSNVIIQHDLACSGSDRCVKSCPVRLLEGQQPGSSAFFYCPKPSGAEKSLGLAGDNPHCTVKPVELMRWLCRLVTPPGGTVCDPFAGSGTTGVAAIREGFSFVGIEIDETFHAAAQARLEAEITDCEVAS